MENILKDKRQTKMRSNEFIIDYDNRRKVGERIKARGLVASKTTGTHVGLRVEDKYGTFKWCPISRFPRSSCLAVWISWCKSWDNSSPSPFNYKLNHNYNPIISYIIPNQLIHFIYHFSSNPKIDPGNWPVKR